MISIKVPSAPGPSKSLQASAGRQLEHLVAHGSPVSPQGTEKRLYYLSRGRLRHTNLFGRV